MGNRQKEETTFTKYRIITALYTQPYTYQQLWRITKIHRNTLKLRLNQLTNHKIVIKHHYTFLNYRGKYTGDDFYLLNWTEKSKEIVSLLFKKYLTEDSVSIMNYFSRASYEINSIQVKPSERQYAILRQGRVYSYGFLPDYKFKEKVRELVKIENDIFEKIRLNIILAEPVEERDKLIEKRDSIIESLILLCTNFCAYVFSGNSLSSYDMLVFFATKGLFYKRRPYVKFWEVMQRIGF